MFKVLALYQFRSVKNPNQVVAMIKSAAPSDVCGTLIVAHEGINGTIAGSEASMNVMLDVLNTLGFDQMEYKFSHAIEKPFLRFKVLEKKEIVTIGCDANPCSVVGTYVAPKDWNDLITQPDVLVIDTRNDYEYALGTFSGAVNPNTECFRDFPKYVASIDRKQFKRVAMFCTGGIRCEKASSYMLSEGFEEVYHLKGGILKYLEEVDRSHSLWEGACFVFDRRVALGHQLEITGHKLCFACRHVLSPKDRLVDYQEGVHCRYCINNLTALRRARCIERQKQTEIAQSQDKQHIGA
ncbi:rhodanese-related sulfurtransferase [Candidatus Comchoanobacter bicostacola]|uniref:tRNA uridine(34) hydroxylase n=1 Tax=Candidatus Comchoanobacter bicostacola TaxID=2919598 RepID=A0ABY5DL73_9GAMM|nr:rhodanese-related sulfurtransferase [Candidatus Comchoanobacter bicostacola]UTC24875.1 rhodanese-related sulfurtransferase [Candidatus Comchoanobacter bicostacola]